MNHLSPLKIQTGFQRLDSSLGTWMRFKDFSSKGETISAASCGLSFQGWKLTASLSPPCVSEIMPVTWEALLLGIASIKSFNPG